MTSWCVSKRRPLTSDPARLRRSVTLKPPGCVFDDGVLA